MTEEEKGTHLVIVREIVRQAEPQFDTSEHQKLFDDLIQKAALDSFMRQEYMVAAEKVSDVIDSYDERIQGMRDVIAYIEQTPANELVAKEIAARLKEFTAPKNN